MSGAISLSDSIFEVVRARILEGILPPGERLVELRLAEEFGSSQGPVREALHRLVQEGLAVRNTNSGTRVVQIEPADYSAIIELRGYLESMAIRRAIQRASDREFGRIRTSVDAMLEAAHRGDRAERMKHDLEFHSQICRLAGSRVIENTWRSISAHAQLVMHQFPTSPEQEIGIAESHEPILLALLERNEEAAAMANLKHLPEMVDVSERGPRLSIV